MKPRHLIACLLSLASALSACRGPKVYVLGPTPPIASCDEAFARGADGDACAIPEGLCRLELGCCVEEIVCESGVLLRFGERCDACGICAADAECPVGSWCIGGDCVPCTAEPACPPCPAGLQPFDRNGCGTCECVPLVQCVNASDCDPGRSLICVPGAACVACGDGECCSSACATRDCPPGLAPEGCEEPCADPSACPSGICRRFDCFCDAMGWRCAEECADELLSPCG